jgi:ABC-type sugar transport system substrate-binding protein
LNVECDWVGPTYEERTGKLQAFHINEIVNMRLNGTKHYDGLAISVIQAETVKEPIRRALDAGMSVICFDSDATDSDRQAYVGTDNFAFGEQMGKALLQFRPTGGNFAMFTIPGENLKLRVEGIRSALEGSAWTELPDSLTFEQGTIDDALQQMVDLKKQNPDVGAILPTYGGLMNEALLWTDFVDDNSDLTFIVADAMPHQVRCEYGKLHVRATTGTT